MLKMIDEDWMNGGLSVEDFVEYVEEDKDIYGYDRDSWEEWKECRLNDMFL